MAQLGDQQPGRLAQAAGQVLRSGRMVIRAITPKKKGGGLTSGSPSAPPSPGQASVADELTSGSPNAPLSLGQANFGASGQTSGLPSVSPARMLLQQMQAALARLLQTVLPHSLTETPNLEFRNVRDGFRV